MGSGGGKNSHTSPPCTVTFECVFIKSEGYLKTNPQAGLSYTGAFSPASNIYSLNVDPADSACEVASCNSSSDP